MRKRKWLYCIHCGTKNDCNNKLCSSCHRILSKKNHEFLDYVYDKVTSNVKDGVIDNILDFLKALVKKYCYGVVLTLSVILTTVAIVENLESKQVDESIIGTAEVLQIETEEIRPFDELIVGCWQLGAKKEGLTYFDFWFSAQTKKGTKIMSSHTNEFYAPQTGLYETNLMSNFYFISEENDDDIETIGIANYVYADSLKVKVLNNNLIEIKDNGIYKRSDCVAIRTEEELAYEEGLLEHYEEE